MQLQHYNKFRFIYSYCSLDVHLLINKETFKNVSVNVVNSIPSET
jgi:hypothetical protein